jgi:hypothetical protein
MRVLEALLAANPSQHTLYKTVQTYPTQPEGFCPHHVWKGGQPVALYCCFCSPEVCDASFMPGRKVDARSLLAPLRNIGTDRRDFVAEGRRANRREKLNNACPNCQSDYRYAIDGSSDVECSECGTRWRPIRRSDVCPQSELAEVAA